MPSNGLGYAFAPTFENAGEGRSGGSPAVQHQTPLQVLSFNLPKFKGAAGGLSPQQGTHRAGSAIGQAVLESVFHTVLGAGAASMLGQVGGAQPTPMDAFQPPAPARTPAYDAPTPSATDNGLSDIVRGPESPRVKEPTPTATTPGNPFAPTAPDPTITAPPRVAAPPVFVPGEDDDTPPIVRDGGGGGSRGVIDQPTDAKPPRFRIPNYKLDVLEPYGMRDDSQDSQAPAFARFTMRDWV